MMSDIHPNVRMMGEILREVEGKLAFDRKERRAYKNLMRDLRLDAWKYLNRQRRYGVFEDKYYHLVNIGHQFRATGDYSLNRILWHRWLGETFGSRPNLQSK